MCPTRSESPPERDRERELAERVREAVLAEARRAWSEAGMSGLCAEGAWEAAVGAAASLDLAPILEPAPKTDD